MEKSVNQYKPGNDGVLTRHRAKWRDTSLDIHGLPYPHLETLDFPLSDPWSELVMRPAVTNLRQRGWFSGQKVMELGVGDGRNLRVAGFPDGAVGVSAVDIEMWKLELAWRNLRQDTDGQEVRTDFFLGDGVDFLQEFGQDLSPGRVLICLPQSFGVGTSADIIEVRESYRPYQGWDRYGLTLNAAVLDNLRSISTDTTEVLIIISHRIPESAVDEMFRCTGWRASEVVMSARVQQDQDTKLDWMSTLPDDGRRFYDFCGQPISTIEAISRINSFGKGDRLNVYHDVSAFRLSSARE